MSNTNTNLPQHRQPWTRSVRVLIIDHLITMDINISLWIDIVEEIVRS
jgi:hypothetical protein